MHRMRSMSPTHSLEFPVNLRLCMRKAFSHKLAELVGACFTNRAPKNIRKFESCYFKYQQIFAYTY